LNPFFSVPINIITIIEIFEEVEITKKLLRTNKGKLSSKRISIIRIAMLTIIYLLTLLSTDVSAIFGFVGAMFGPVLGFIIPVIS